MLLEDQVRGAREDIVRSHEEIFLEAFFLAPVISGQDLLIGLRARIHDVGGAFVALELHRIPEQVLGLLEHGQHCLAARRGPAAEYGDDAVAVDQLGRLLRAGRRIGCAVLGHRFDLLARSEEHTSELQSLMSTSYAVFRLKKKTQKPEQKAKKLLKSNNPQLIPSPNIQHPTKIPNNHLELRRLSQLTQPTYIT